MQLDTEESVVMISNAEKALKTVLDVRKKEKVMVITDEESEDIALAFNEACKGLGLNSSLIYLSSRKNGPIRDLSKELAKELDHANIYINTFKAYAEETPFRIKLLDIEMKRGARIAHAPGIDRNMLIKGALTADFDEMWNTARKLMDVMEGVSEVHITTKKGTDLKLKISGRKFQTDIKIGKNQIGNLPAGEIWCAPLEDGADGVAVIDGSIGDIGFPPCPLKIHMKSGKITAIECSDEGFKKRLEELLHADELSDVIGELGIGLNPGAELIGNMLVDEKAAKTVHIAFGNNIDFYGGKNTSSMHRDFLMKRPNMEIIYSDGRQKRIMENGELRME